MRRTYRTESDDWREQLPRLRVFERVAHTKSFTGAARELGLSQPAVSRSVAALEEHLGAKLLERDGRAVRLTAAGEAAHASARRVRDELDRLGASLRSEASEPRGDFACYAAEHAASLLLAEPIHALATRFTKIVPRVITAPAHLAIPEIADDRAELGFFFKVEPHARVEKRHVASFKCQLVCHPSKVRDARTLATFIGSREVDDRRNTSFPTVDMLKRHRPETRIAYSSNSLALHTEWVRAGVGVSILPLFVVERELEAHSLRIVHPDWVYWADFFAVVRKGRVLSIASRTLMQSVRARCRALGGRTPSVRA